MARKLLAKIGREVKKLLLQARKLCLMLNSGKAICALSPMVTGKIENVFNELLDLNRRFSDRKLK